MRGACREVCWAVHGRVEMVAVVVVVVVVLLLLTRGSPALVHMCAYLG